MYIKAGIKSFLHVSPRCSLLITDYIFGKNVSLPVSDKNFTKNFTCGTHFQFHNHDLFEKVHWN